MRVLSMEWEVQPAMQVQILGRGVRSAKLVRPAKRVRILKRRARSAKQMRSPPRETRPEMLVWILKRAMLVWVLERGP